MTTITARQATTGTVLRLEGPTQTDQGVELVVMKATVVRWEGNGDGTATLVARGARGTFHAGQYPADHTFRIWR